jgi:hypothetical protein
MTPHITLTHSLLPLLGGKPSFIGGLPESARVILISIYEGVATFTHLLHTFPYTASHWGVSTVYAVQYIFPPVLDLNC